jgi:hypothetical protein
MLLKTVILWHEFPFDVSFLAYVSKGARTNLKFLSLEELVLAKPVVFCEEAESSVFEVVSGLSNR